MARLLGCVVVACFVGVCLAEEIQGPLPTSCSHAKDPQHCRGLRQIEEDVDGAADGGVGREVGGDTEGDAEGDIEGDTERDAGDTEGDAGGDVGRDAGGDVSLGALAAFPMYAASYHLSKYFQGSSRALEETLHDLTRILTCLKEEEFTPDLHLNCFFPFYFSRKESVRMSQKLWKFTGALFEGDLVTPWADLPGQLVQVLGGTALPSGPTLSPTAEQVDEGAMSVRDDDDDENPSQGKPQNPRLDEISSPPGPTFSFTAAQDFGNNDENILGIQELIELTRTEEEKEEGEGGEEEPKGEVTSESPNKRRVKRQFNGGDIISVLAIVVFGAFLFYVLYFHISKYLQGRSLDSYRMEDHLRQMTRILMCLEEENFVPRLECFVSSRNF
ncbi:uncharacterized protein [Penaeus vannamei]|uniref:uncharacterized protein n=1 Tax=Penaeus vannamei TaxID=6689 RepID=UPI00387F8E1F